MGLKNHLFKSWKWKKKTNKKRGEKKTGLGEENQAPQEDLCEKKNNPTGEGRKRRLVSWV